MKRFLQKSYSWLATLLFAVAFAVSGNAAAGTVTLPLNNGGGTVDGVSYTYGSCDWAGTTNIYNDFTAADGWGYITLACFTENIVKVELTTTGGANTVYEYNHNGSVTTNGNVVVWEGSAQELGFTSSADVYINKIVVYTEAGGGGEVVTASTSMPLNNGGGTVDGISYTYGSCDWAGTTNIYNDFTAADGWGYITLSCFDKDIVKVELTTTGGANTVYEYNHNGSVTTNGNVVVWEGSAHELGFTSSADVYINKIIVYTEAAGGIVKDCSIDVDHFADNVKPGKVTSISKWITLYMQANTLTTGWTGGHNCPEGVTFKTEAGEEIPVDQFNYWQNSDQIGVNLYEEITTPGVYTLHIPEGLVVFEGGKFNKEINATWTVVAPDTRPTKDVVFDFTDGTYTNDGTLSYTKDGVVFTLNENRYNATAQGFRIATDGWVSFAAPEKATIKSIQLLQESSYGVSPDFTANVGEVSVYDKTLYWSGDDASVTLTDNYGTCYFTKAIVTLAVEESVEPTTTFKGVVTPNLTSVSSLDELEGIQLTLVDADKVSVLEESYGIYVQNEDGGEVYAVWHPYYGGTYEIDGNVITLRNFYSDSSNSYFAALPAGEFDLYFEDYGTFDVSNAAADWDGYFQTFTVAYKGAPAPVPFELVFRNNNVVCENGQKVEANEAGVGVDFYLENEGLTAVGKTATLYKDGNAMSFVMTFVDATAISFLGGSSLITEPGTYLLEVPEGTYVDAAGNPSVAYYGTWVVIQKDEPVEPVKDKYTIKLSGTDYYFTTAEVKDNSVTTYSLSATPEYFYIEPSNGGYTIQSADTEKWVGYDVTNSWDFSNHEKVWNIGSLEGEPTLIYKNNAYGYNANKGFGVDNKYEFAGVYTDKSGQYWVIEKFEEGGEVVDPVEPVDLEQFAGTWYFKGEGAYLNYYEEDMTPKDEYVVNVEAKDGKLYMTDLIGFVYDDPNAFIGTYDAQAETLTFNTPYTTCYVVDNRYEYYTNFQPLVFNVVKDEEGNVSLVNTTGWDFMYEDWYYTTYACGYTSCVMTREQQIVDPEPEGWNGEIAFSEANSLDDLLTLTVEFEDAKTVEAAGSDVLGVVFEENGNPYAIVLGNGVFDVFGGVTFDGGKATVEFVKIADLSADLQASAKASAARIGGFTSEGKASVVFASKSFKVDGNLVTDIIVNNYEFNGSEPTGVESIATSKVDTIFDLGGRRVVNTNGGLYIVNGRKVYMK